MIKAKITLFDDETGEIFTKDKIIEPLLNDEIDIDESKILHHLVKKYDFRFCLKRIDWEGPRLNDPVFMQQEKMHTMPSDTQ